MKALQQKNFYLFTQSVLVAMYADLLDGRPIKNGFVTIMSDDMYTNIESFDSLLNLLKIQVPLPKEAIGFLEDRLADPETIGFATNSDNVIEHLKRTGTFSATSLNQTKSIQTYSRNDRTYDFFDAKLQDAVLQ